MVWSDSQEEAVAQAFWNHIADDPAEEGERVNGMTTTARARLVDFTAGWEAAFQWATRHINDPR